MKSYCETIAYLAEKAYSRFILGYDSYMVGKYETHVVGFIYNIPSEKVFDDVYDLFTKMSRDE